MYDFLGKLFIILPYQILAGEQTNIGVANIFSMNINCLLIIHVSQETFLRPGWKERKSGDTIIISQRFSRV